MNFKKNSAKDVKKNSAISSAALQDHLLRKFNFNFENQITSSYHVNKESVRRKTLDKLPKISRGI
jgi:hypothetical protein